MLRELRVLLRRSFRHPDESIKRGLIYTSVCDHSGTATVNGVARSELTPPCSNTHMQMHAHMCSIYHLPHTRIAELTHTHVHTHACTRILTAIHSYSHSGSHMRTQEYYCLWSFWKDRGERGGWYESLQRKKPKCLSVYLIWAFSACFIHSVLSAGIWGPRCEHWVYKCFVLFICLPSKPEEATGGEWKWGRERLRRFFFSRDEEETSA